MLRDDDTFEDDTGQVLRNVHSETLCQGRACAVHQPSDHHLRHLPLHYRFDRGIFERICEHGVGHPDPDDYKINAGRDDGIHGCDGCCTQKAT